LTDNPNELKRCRYSALDWLSKCPAYIYLIYKEGLAEFRHPAALVGSAVHEVLHKYAQHCFDRKRVTDDEVYDEIVSSVRPTLPPHLQGDYLSVCRKVKSVTHFQLLADADSVHIERRLGIDSDYKPTASTSFFSGAIDLYHVNGDVAYAMDYKTSREAITDGGALASLQREIYSWLILKHHPEVEEVSFEFVMSRYGQATEPIVFSREDDMDEFEARLRVLIDEYYTIVSAGAMPTPRPGSHCVLCGAMAACPAYHQAFAFDERIETAEDAQRFCANYLLAEHKMKHWKDVLQNAVEAYGDLPAGEQRVYGNRPSASKKYDFAKVMAQLDALCIDKDLISKKLGVTGTALKSICRAADIPIETFDGFAKVSMKNNYRAHKVGDQDDGEEEA
jgi:CRISPR/Cas system-associated exonuclease Cas4 (RecB family)